MAAPRLMDPERSRVLLVGAAAYAPESGLDDLPSVPAGIGRLHDLLVDPACGGLRDEACLVLLDPVNPGEVDSELCRCAKDAAHTLLVYYSGHGVLDSRGTLHLALRHTDRQRPYSTAWPYDWVRAALLESAAAIKVVILDCCFSGRAIRVMSAHSVAEQAAVAGSYVMAAAAANKLAAAPEDEQYTAFTGALIETLEQGVRKGPERLDLDTVFRAVHTALVRRNFPPPQVQRTDDAGNLALAVTRWRVRRRAPSISVDEDHYWLVARRLLDGAVIPVVGEGANLAGREPHALWEPSGNLPPTESEVAAQLANEAQLDDDDDVDVDVEDLHSVFEFLQHDLGRRFPHERLEALLRSRAPGPVHRLLAAIPRFARAGEGFRSLVIITTCLDDALEAAFAAASEPCDLLVYSGKRGRGAGRFDHVDPAGGVVSVDLPNEYVSLDPARRPVIVRLRGGAPENYVVTDEEQQIAMDQFHHRLPIALRRAAVESHLLFLGQSLRRGAGGRATAAALLRGLPSPLDMKSWAVQEGQTALDARLWDRMGVEPVNADLATYARELTRELAT